MNAEPKVRKYLSNCNLKFPTVAPAPPVCAVTHWFRAVTYSVLILWGKNAQFEYTQRESKMSSYPFRFFVILFCLGLFAGACSKSDEGPGEGKDGSGQYFIRYKANGINHEYTAGKLVYAIQLTLPDTDAKQFLIQGRKHENDQQRDAVFFGVTDVLPIKVGTVYRLAERLEWPEHNQSISRVFGSHYSTSGEKYFAQLHPQPSLPFEVKDEASAQFSQITDKTVKGTFSMRAYTTYPDLKEVVVTDGEFYVPILAPN